MRRVVNVLTGPLLGLLVAAIAVGVGEAVAAFVRPAASPIIAVANRVVLLTPSSTKRSAESSFGTDDKTVLIVSVFVLLALFGVLAGQLALRRLAYGLAATAVLGGFGAWCALTDNASRTTDAIPSVVATLVAAVVLVVLVRAVDHDEHASGSIDRRVFLQAGAATAGVAAIAGFGGRGLQHARFDVAAARNKVALPAPAVRTQALPSGVDLGRSGVPWQTPSDRFYRIDTSLSVPQIAPKDWRLRIHGMVDREITIDYQQLLARPQIERWVTLCCVSNEVGGGLIGNARWLGARLRDLLDEAGVHPDADQLLLSSPDGMTIGAPAKVVMDGRDALLAVGMNGAALPVEHGFPARVIVPGLYGYVANCKWVIDIEATTFADAAAYWIQGGWAQQNSIKLGARIDTPHSGTVKAGSPVPVAGVAWDQHTGVSAVQVQVDDGPWHTTRLAAVPSTDTWRQWLWPWTPSAPGSHTLRVRAVDGKGVPQDEARQPVFPSGATGLHTISVTVA